MRGKNAWPVAVAHQVCVLSVFRHRIYLRLELDILGVTNGDQFRDDIAVNQEVI